MKRQIYSMLLFLLPAICSFGPLFARQQKDTVSVYFPFNESKLPVRQQEVLDSLSYNEILTPDKDLMIIGYADFPGTNDYNTALSQRRAGAVLAYLKTLGFRQDNIELCVGKGELEHASADTGKGYAPDRRVDIVILHRKAGKATTPVTTHHTSPADTPKKNILQVAKNTRRPGPVKPAVVLKDFSDLAKMPEDATVILNNVYFPSGRHFVTENSRYQLEQLYDALSSHPTIRVRIEGHVCCVYGFHDAFDEDDQSDRLSVNRARFIYDFLIRRGIDASRMDYIGFGHSRPVVYPEIDEDDAQQNRRVEVRILSK